MANKLKSMMLKAIETRLQPYFISRGFAVIPLRQDEEESEIGPTIPLGRLVRDNGSGLDIVEFNFSRPDRGDAKFRINFGAVLNDGVGSPVIGKRPAEYVGVEELDVFYRLAPRRSPTSWFKIGLFQKHSAQNVERLIEKALSLAPEAEQWFSAGLIGRHVREIDTTNWPKPVSTADLKP